LEDLQERIEKKIKSFKENTWHSNMTMI
jgi:hypothetical protein